MTSPPVFTGHHAVPSASTNEAQAARAIYRLRALGASEEAAELVLSTWAETGVRNLDAYARAAPDGSLLVEIRQAEEALFEAALDEKYGHLSTTQLQKMGDLTARDLDELNAPRGDA
ncbi:hypothetical protein [Nocardioides sp. Kera G14]|uniref:hypothetical protein n=1 Tax=Nocardioides sp. Kera G14 TaxID=2884264 RepID=UPI001D114ABA|nr:hypothetical protein [Nocardioides sp. Kera G14]UDY22401.1 hypothetical protein LH076_09945 [Nocardioides sp. Kera G14]